MNETSRIIKSQRNLFDIPEDVAYLNCAYMSPLSIKVAQAGAAAIAAKQHPWGTTSEDFFALPDKGRRLFAQLIGAQADDIAVVPAISYGIATAANNIPLKAGQEIVVLEGQFSSNVYAWREAAKAAGAEIVTIPYPSAPDGRKAYDGWMSGLMKAIGPKTAVVAVPHCHWTDGSLIDLVTVRGATRKVGAALVLDLAQSAGALPFDVSDVQPDYAVAVCYKWLMGPYSLGFMYIAPEHRDGRPLEHNWIGRAGSDDFAGLVGYTDALAPGVRGFDMGERAQFQLMPMGIAALEQVLEWGVDNIAATLREKTTRIAERAAGLGLVSVPPEARAGHYLGLRFPGGVPEGLLEQLADRQVFVSVRGDSMRVTPHLYNMDDDVERLFEALEAVL